jgi:polyisoprenoid-binding protein YceI
MSTIAAAVQIPTGTWNVDPSHSSIEFQVKHLGIATVKGYFQDFAGALVVDEDGLHASGTVQVASVDTREDKRDEHLRSADFFDVENHAEISYVSTAIEPIDDESFRVTGDLTIRGVTNSVTLEASVEGYEQDPWGNDRVGLEAHGQIKRGDYGINFNQALGSGNLLVGEKVKILVEISAIKAA